MACVGFRTRPSCFLIAALRVSLSWWWRPRRQKRDSGGGRHAPVGVWQFDGRACCRNCHFLGHRRFGDSFADAITPSSWSAEERRSIRIEREPATLRINAIEVHCQQGFLATEHVVLDDDPSLESIRSRLTEDRRSCSFIEFQPGVTFDAAVNLLQERRSQRRFRIGLRVGIATFIAAIGSLGIGICGLVACGRLLDPLFQ